MIVGLLPGVGLGRVFLLEDLGNSLQLNVASSISSQKQIK